ncbi:MAG: EamA family transporter [Chloroflexi bacterium]|nr:EamA family transporter [Chloroflexota bacterium]
MTGLAILLVVLSAFAHSGWNFLTKRANNPEIFTWWAALSANVLLAPVAVFLLVRDPPGVTGWIFMAATWSLHLTYFTSLSRAYRHSDLSLVYPIARGTGLLLIPFLGVSVLNETMSAAAIAGVGLIAGGIFAVSFGNAFEGGPGSFLSMFKQPGIRYALLTGIIISAYSIVDKRGVAHVTPLVYMYFLTSAGTLGMPLLLARRYPKADFAKEWRFNAGTIIVTGLLQFAAYALVLTALRFSKVSYVAPVREIGIVIGVLMGALLLNEPFKRGRVLGGLLIVAGAVSIAVAP